MARSDTDAQDCIHREYRHRIGTHARRGPRLLGGRARTRRDSPGAARPALPRGRAGPRAVQRHQPRHRGARVPGPRPAQRVRAHARAVPGRETFPRRSSTATPASDAVEQRSAQRSGPATCSCCIRTRRATSCRRRPCTCCPTACRPDARCWPPTSRRRSTALWDARAAHRRSHRGRRRQARWAASWRGSPDASRAARSSSSTSIPRRAGVAAHSASGSFAPRQDAGARPTSSFTRAAHPPGSCSRSRRRLRGHHRRNELVSAIRQVPLPLGEAFHARRLTTQVVAGRHVAAAQRARWDSRRRMQLALRLLSRSGARCADHRREPVRRRCRR